VKVPRPQNLSRRINRCRWQARPKSPSRQSAFRLLLAPQARCGHCERISSRLNCCFDIFCVVGALILQLIVVKSAEQRRASIESNDQPLADRDIRLRKRLVVQRVQEMSDCVQQTCSRDRTRRNGLIGERNSTGINPDWESRHPLRRRSWSVCTSSIVDLERWKSNPRQIFFRWKSSSQLHTIAMPDLDFKFH